MNQDNTEVVQSPEKKEKSLEIIDLRSIPDTVQVLLLSERIKKDHLVEDLTSIKRLLGSYASDVAPESISVTLIDGKWGSGECKGKIINIALPSDQEVVGLMTPFVESRPQIEGSDKDSLAREVANVALASTVLHEATHVLIDSKPGSRMDLDLGVNDSGETSTMIDEGITYALQGIYAKEPFLVPEVGQGDEKEVRTRKRLGEKIRPRVKELVDGKKVIDKDFLKYCLGVLEQVKAGEN